MEADLFDCVVIGKGLIGSSAIKHLRKNGANCAIVGPDEPRNWKEHHGVFSSHYDSGRLVRSLDEQLTWGRIIHNSSLRLSDIENESGRRFYFPVGCLKIAPETESGAEYIRKNVEVGETLAIDFSGFDSSTLSDHFPFLSVPFGGQCLFERGSAGWLDPRKLIEAQLLIAEREGTKVFHETVVELADSRRGLVYLTTDFGRVLKTKTVLYCVGSYSNANNLLGDELELRARGETVVLAQVTAETANSIWQMPSLILHGHESTLFGNVYIVPPAVYPDGRKYIKIGARSLEANVLHSVEDIASWFHTDGNKDIADEMKSLLKNLLPTIDIIDWQTKPCVLTDTPTGYPYIDRISEGVWVATGGNGFGAMAADELGRMSMKEVMQDRDSTYDFDLFKLQYKASHSPVR